MGLDLSLLTWRALASARLRETHIRSGSWRVILVEFRKLKSCGHLRAGAEANEVAASIDDDRLDLDEAGKDGPLGIRLRLSARLMVSCARIL